MFRGSMVAIITPFKNGKVDEKRLSELIEFHIKNNTSAIVPCGTTGESATLSFEEHERVIELTIKQVKKRIAVIAGTGSNSTQEAIELTRQAEKAGADASLQVSPYYNKPTQKGLYEHFKAIAKSVKIPLIVYNIAGRTAVNIEPITLAKLATDCKNIVGVKEASGNLNQMSQIRHLCPKEFALISGDDSLTLPIASVGGKGVISVVANIVPTDVKAFTDAILDGDFPSARQWHNKLFQLGKALLSLATNPIPIKAAMALLHMASEEVRLPLVPLGPSKNEQLAQILTKYGLM